MSVNAAEWKAASLQAVLFTKAPTPRTVDIFSMLVGSPADTVEERAKEGFVRQMGRLGDKLLQVGVNPIRIDIVLSPPPPEPTPDDPGVRIAMGSFEDELNTFSIMVRKFLNEADLPIVRASLVCAALAETDSRSSAYEVLAGHLKSVKVESEMEELLYRVNWKAKTELLEESYLNRIATWSAVKLSVSAGTSPFDARPLSQTNFARIELDINSPAERTEIITKDRVVSIFDRFVFLALENIKKGECK